ncbi:MAG: hypothetical protein NC410_03205 [Oscillibacter sp.]|nr:hypothetical protein [Oscillibacter sp.]
MRVVKYFFRSLALIVMVVLLWGGSTHSGYASPTNSWTDSLRVSIVDSTVVSLSGVDYLEFKIVVERINEDWNTPPAPDTVLGNCDLYFHANFEAFVGDPLFTHVHDSLSAGAVVSVGGNSNAILQANIGIWAERLHIALTRQDQGNTLIGVPVNPNAKYRLKLAVGKPDTLCTVHWQLANPHSVKLGIEWDAGDKGSTGLQTYGGNPIIETLTGDILKLPADSLVVDCMPEELYACEGGAVAIGMHAESTGVGPIFEWYDSIPGGDRSYPVLASATTQDQTTAGGKRYTYDYRFNATGDTLYIDKVPNSVDSIYFYCVVSDTTLTTRPSKYCKTRLFVRDSIKGFVSPMNSLYTLNKIDTITICPEDSVVSVRFNFFGVTYDELADVDSIYMIYRNDPCNGDILTEDTVGMNMASVLSEAMIDGMEVWYWDAPIKAKRGKVYIQKIGSYYCDNAAVAFEYDTIFIKEDNLQMLPRVTVAAKGNVIIDSVTSTIFSPTQSYNTLNLLSLRGLGTPKKGNSSRLPFVYTAKDTMGLDTVLYENVPGKQCAYMREVEVQDLKYLTLKVYLWGAWRSALNSMYAFMDKNNLNYFSNMKDNSGAFFESPYDPNCKITTNRLREIVQDRETAGELGFVDWIEVDLVEAQATGSTNRPFQITQKVDSVSAFLRTDGIVCDTAGNPYIGFKNLPQNDYYVVVRHRNHLGMMSGMKVPLLINRPTTATAVVADFTSTIFSIAGSPNVAYYRSANVNYMYVGNTDGNDRITVSDFNKIKLFSGGSLSNYYKEDLNFDLKVTSTDINLWKSVVVGNPTEAYY